MKNRITNITFILLGLNFSVFSLNAQITDSLARLDSLLKLTLDEFVITSHRIETKAFYSNSAISILPNRILTKSFQRNTPEVLLETPGVYLQKTNHGGGSAFIRGLTGNQVLYLIDGIRLNNAITGYGPNQYLNTIDKFGLNQIEVLRGAGAVLFGSDAIGGVLQMLSYIPSKDLNNGIHTQLLSRMGTNDLEKTIHGRINYKNGENWITAGITGRAFGDLLGGKNTGYQHPSGYNEINFDGKFNFQVGKRSSIIGLFQKVKQNDVPVFHKYLLENFEINKMDPQERYLGYLRYQFTPLKGFIKNIKVTSSIQHSSESRWSKKNNNPITKIENDSIRTCGLTTEIHTMTIIGKIKWTGIHGIDSYWDRVNSQRFQISGKNPPIFERGLYPNNAEQRSTAIYSNQYFELKNTQITLGNRFQSILLKIPTDLSNLKLSPSAWVGNFDISQMVHQNLKLILGINAGFRAPNIDDLGSLGIVDFRYEIPNYQLEPEKSIQLQFGFKHHAPRFNLEYYIYHNQLKDLIVRYKKENEIIEGYPVFFKENAENGFIRGMESNFQYFLTKHFQLIGAMTYTFGQNTSKGEPLRRIPPLFGFMQIQYKKEKYWSNLNFHFSSKQTRLAAGDISDNRIGKDGTAGWQVLHLSNGLNLGKINLSLTLQNLFNVDYKFHGSGIMKLVDL